MATSRGSRIAAIAAKLRSLKKKKTNPKAGLQGSPVGQPLAGSKKKKKKKKTDDTYTIQPYPNSKPVKRKKFLKDRIKSAAKKFLKFKRTKKK